MCLPRNGSPLEWSGPDNIFTRRVNGPFKYSPIVREIVERSHGKEALEGPVHQYTSHRSESTPKRSGVESISRGLKYRLLVHVVSPASTFLRKPDTTTKGVDYAATSSLGLNNCTWVAALFCTFSAMPPVISNPSLTAIMRIPQLQSHPARRLCSIEHRPQSWLRTRPQQALGQYPHQRYTAACAGQRPMGGTGLRLPR